MDGSVWVILPTYDEAENLAAVVGGVRAAVPDAHLLVVDDNSQDGTAELADALADSVVHRAAKTGLGRAYVAGFDTALAHGAELVIEMDADLSHDPADLPRLIAAARDGADLVLGSRYAPGGGGARPGGAPPALWRGRGAGPPATCSAWRCATSRAGSSASAPRPWRRSTSRARAPRATSSRSSSPGACCARGCA